MPDPSPEPKTVLVVEDQNVVRRMVARALEEEGYRVLEASDGEQALELLSRGPRVDLVVSDVVMPNMGGFVLAERLLLGGEPPIFLFITGYDQDPTKVPGPLLQKPFTPTELVAEVKRLMAQAVRSGEP